jgi:TetR/AcrR family hemagglutinin/protease transcriptional regulator
VVAEVARFYLEMDRRFLEEADLPVPETIVALGRAFAESVDSHPDHARVFLDWSNSVGDEIFPRYLAFQEQVIAMLTEALRRGRENGFVAVDVIPEDAGRIVFAAAQMVVQLKLTGTEASRIDRFLISLTRAAVGHPVRED